MARLNARWTNFYHRGQRWWRFWQDTGAAAPPPTEVLISQFRSIASMVMARMFGRVN